MSIRAVFWPLGGQSETDPYDREKFFLRLTNRPRRMFGKMILKPVLIVCAWADRAGNNWTYIGTNRGGGGARH